MKKTIIFSFTVATSIVLLFQNCGKKDFTVDTSNPVPNTPSGYVGGNSAIKIVINEYPVNGVRTQTQYVDYRVIPVDSTLKDVSCTLDNVDIACDDVDRIEIKDLLAGAHVFAIHAVNSKDETADEVINWSLYNTLSTKTKDITISATRTADIVINIDNSYSMADIQTNMAGRISNLLNKINTLDSYRISVITTDWYNSDSSHAAYTDGKFDRFSNGSYCLTKGVSNASTILGNLVQREESLNPNDAGNGYERGIYTTYRAFERYKTSGSNESNCLRPNVPKHVIMISDENEAIYEEDVDGNVLTAKPLYNQYKSNGDNLISFASQTFGSSSFTFHSIIINPYTTEGQQCLINKQRHIVSSKYGTEFAKLSQKTNGVIGSVCASDYSSSLSVIGDSIIRPEKIYGLDCVAAQQNGSYGSVKRVSNNQPVTSYTINSNKIEFTTDLPNDTYRVTYYCYE